MNWNPLTWWNKKSPENKPKKKTLIGVKIYISGRDKVYPKDEEHYIHVPEHGTYLEYSYQNPDTILDAQGDIVQTYQWAAGYNIRRIRVYSQEAND